MAGAKSVPEVCRHLQRLGDYLRWGSSLAPALLAVDDLGCRDSGVRILILSPYPLVVGGGINVGLYGSAQGAARRWDQRFESALLQQRVTQTSSRWLVGAAVLLVNWPYLQTPGAVSPFYRHSAREIRTIVP
jgi:hypothetical protein